MTYPKPTRFICAVADLSRCASAGSDAEIDIALDWLREQIIKERDRQDAYYERVEKDRAAGSDE